MRHILNKDSCMARSVPAECCKDRPERENENRENGMKRLILSVLGLAVMVLGLQEALHRWQRHRRCPRCHLRGDLPDSPRRVPGPGGALQQHRRTAMVRPHRLDGDPHPVLVVRRDLPSRACDSAYAWRTTISPARCRPVGQSDPGNDDLAAAVTGSPAAYPLR